MDILDILPSQPPPPPPKKIDKPKITLQIPTPGQYRGPNTSSSIYWGPTNTKYYGKATTPASHISDHHFNPFLHMYSNKASDFMFKQFEGFKDFTMNTAKSGLSVGEKSAFWFYNKLKILSKKWFTHFFLTLCLVLYSLMGAAIFMTLEGPYEEKYDKNLTQVRKEFSIRIQDKLLNNQSLIQNNPNFFALIEQNLENYEESFKEYLKHVNNNDTKKKTWTFWNSMFYAGTIYTTIALLVYILHDKIPKIESFNRTTVTRMFENALQNDMSDKESDHSIAVSLKIPIVKSEGVQTSGIIISKSPIKTEHSKMEAEPGVQSISNRKRRNLSKNRGQATRQREKTPEPSRISVPYEDTTSDDEEVHPNRTSREIEADSTYEEMKRLVQEQANVKDPVYDIDTDEILETRAMEANERRRRSISPFALPEKEEIVTLVRKGSFIDPGNKLLSTNYTLSPKEDNPSRRDSLTNETEVINTRNSLSPPPTSPKGKDQEQFFPAAPKKLEEHVYPDEIKTSTDKIKSIQKKDEPISNEKEKKQITKTSTPVPGELVTKIIQVERTPSKKLTQEQKPVIDVRERVVRTPSKKISANSKPVMKLTPSKQINEQQSKVPPVKPARSKSSSRLVSKTSESEMSEDQIYQQSVRRKVVPTPRRFMKNKSPRTNRSNAVAKVEDTGSLNKTDTGMSQTSKEIMELMQKARARSLSIPKDNPRVAPVYKKYSKTLQTPNKTPVNLRHTRGISCPKTIQIISDREILSSLTSQPVRKREYEKHSRRSSGYVDASQSEYTSSCYSSSPSENEYEFDLFERSAELTRKLNKLSQEEGNKTSSNIITAQDDNEKHDVMPKSTLRKRSLANKSQGKEIDKEETERDSPKIKTDGKIKSSTLSRFKLIANWQQFKVDNHNDCKKILLLRNRCVSDLLLIIIMCGLGGMIFKTFEGSFENAYKCGTRNVKRDFIESLWRDSCRLKEEEWKSLARRKLYEFEEQLHTAHEAGVTSYSGQRSWNFMNSFVYCLTLVTTIGYGHIAPKTTYGRVATIVYAIIGIPLFLIVLADFGKLFTRIIKFFWAFIRRFYYTRSCKSVRRTAPVQEVMKGLNIVYDVVRRPSQIFTEEDIEGEHPAQPPPVERKLSDVPPPLPPKPGTLSVENVTEPDTPAPSVFEIDDEFNLPISVAIFILVVYIIIGAVGYNFWETWNFFESFYFVFISMSTIGLGDLVPDHPMFMMASILYLVFGLALTSMCINVVQVKLSDTFKQASAKLGATIGLKVAEEDGSLVPITPPPIEIPAIHKPKSITEEKSKVTKDS